MPSLWLINEAGALALAVALAAVGISLAVMWRIRRGYPPVAPLLRTFDALLFRPDTLLSFKDYCRRRYGQVYSWFVGSKPMVMLAGYDSIYEAFVERADCCSDRPGGVELLFTGTADKGILFSPDWKEQRKFVLTVLREQGMAQVNMEATILSEAQTLLERIVQNGPKPLDVEDLLNKAIANVISGFVLGSKFEYDDPVFIGLLDTFLNHVRRVQRMRMIQRFPILLKLPGDAFGYHKFVRTAADNCAYFFEAVKKHAESLDPACPRDFIDAYLIEIKSRSSTNQQSSFDEASCVAVAVQLFVGGTDTTTATLLWAFLFMLLHPDAQQEVQKEIDSCIGSRKPSMKDRVNMPYTDAVLTEAMRIGNAAAQTLPHTVNANVTVGGHLISKDTTIFGSLSDVHMDEHTYQNPYAFNPSRFIDASGKFNKPKKFIPFGIGRRICPGESLARAEIFLFFTAVLQQYHLGVPPGVRLTQRGRISLSHKPQQYSIVFSSRSRVSSG